MRKTPAEGMNDFLPEDVELRDMMTEKIVEVYRSFGFTKISTPAIEVIENLENSDGGDNLRLIFKIQKRGDKLQKAIAQGEYSNLCDLGLRYDLTLPLARYWANNRAFLPDPFKCIQIGMAYRAERPQKGRSREFVQCDVDVIGSDSLDSEVELITVTARALMGLGIGPFTVRVNDRRILRDVIKSCGFAEDCCSSVAVTVDKLDKIGEDGVRDELTGKGYPVECVGKLLNTLSGCQNDDGFIRQYSDSAVSLGFCEMISRARELAKNNYQIVFDPKLVRGQGYYTGAVFEIESKEFGGTVAGGGRYDGLISRFTGENIPAVGFSIGFERIYSILKEAGRRAGRKKKAAVLYDDGEIVEAMEFADTKRKEYDVALIRKKKKFLKQVEALKKQGFVIFHRRNRLGVFEYLVENWNNNEKEV
ncbi:MAG: histidine--tRNA ligase [Clostridia bacterium]|nr:histidine--tRNA ligase [Clostridia bacterium]